MADFTRSVPCGVCGKNTQEVALAVLCLTCGTWICGACLRRGHYGPTHHKKDQIREDHLTGNHKKEMTQPAPVSTSTPTTTGPAHSTQETPQDLHKKGHTTTRTTQPRTTTGHQPPQHNDSSKERPLQKKKLENTRTSALDEYARRKSGGDTEGFHQKHSPGADYRHHLVHPQRRQI